MSRIFQDLIIWINIHVSTPISLITIPVNGNLKVRDIEVNHEKSTRVKLLGYLIRAFSQEWFMHCSSSNDIKAWRESTNNKMFF